MASPFDCLLFDLDDTLYSPFLGISQHVRRNIEEYLSRKLGVSQNHSAILRAQYFTTYGSSLAALIELGYDISCDDYHRCVHGALPYQCIPPDAELSGLLNSITQTKIVFTNSDRKHAKMVLGRLGIKEECFQGMICFETLNPHLFDTSPPYDALPRPRPPVILKPSAATMEAAIAATGFDPCRTLLLDDSERNIAAGKALGLRTALVGKKGRCREADYVVESLSSLRLAIPEIWGEVVKGAAKEVADSIRAPVEA